MDIEDKEFLESVPSGTLTAYCNSVSSGSCQFHVSHKGLTGSAYIYTPTHIQKHPNVFLDNGWIDNMNDLRRFVTEYHQGSQALSPFTICSSPPEEVCTGEGLNNIKSQLQVRR